MTIENADEWLKAYDRLCDRWHELKDDPDNRLDILAKEYGTTRGHMYILTDDLAKSEYSHFNGN